MELLQYFSLKFKSNLEVYSLFPGTVNDYIYLAGKENLKGTLNLTAPKMK
jgi:hypothetical protein